jgi:hypothetical protein
MVLKKLMIAALATTALCGVVEAATVTLTWTPPTTRTDGSALPAAQIARADIYDAFGCSITPCPNPAGNVVGNVTGAIGTFKTPGLAAGAHTFTVFTIDTGVPAAVSPSSNAVTLTIVVPPPAAITNLTGTVGP